MINIFTVDNNFSWKVREKRAKKMLTREAASKEIGISRKTLSLIETGSKREITKTVYEKIVNWLLKEIV